MMRILQLDKQIKNDIKELNELINTIQTKYDVYICYHTQKIHGDIAFSIYKHHKNKYKEVVRQSTKFAVDTSIANSQEIIDDILKG